MAAVAPASMASVPQTITSLPYRIETSCPPALSHKPGIGTAWPFVTCGPVSQAGEDGQAFLRRRYLETLLMPEILMPIKSLQADIARLDSSSTRAEAIRPLLISLKQLERKHRIVMKQLMEALRAEMTSTSLPEVKRALLDEAIDKSGLEQDEVSVIRVAVELRAGTRKAVESGETLDVRRTVDELERRDALIQTLLLFHYIPLHQPEKGSKRKRDKSKHGSKSSDTDAAPLPSENPQAALTTLLDRLSIWSALADLNLGSTAESSEGGWAATLLRFWQDIIDPSFLASQPDLCATFHQKVFAAPLPASALPAPVPVRPSMPSRDQISRSTSVSVRAPSEASDQSHSHPLHRSMSRTSDQQPIRRSRSRSIDPAARAANTAIEQTKRPLVRAPSGKDLFEGREVGLLRRTASRKGSQEQVGKGDGVQSLGLLGRKTSDPKQKRRVSNDESQSQSQSQSQPGTIVFATPAKPRFGSSRGGMWHHPTPIQEERASFVAETPSTNRTRIAGTPSTAMTNRVADTPRSGRRLSDSALTEQDEDDDLGDLMVMTDDDDEDEPDTRVIPETPLR